MDSQSLLQPLNMAVPFTLSFLFLLTLLFRRLRSKLPFPPGPKGLPFIGNMLMMEQLTHRGLANLAARYGGIFYMRMGFVNMFVVSNPDIARQVLQVHDSICSNRPATIAISYLTYNCADMAFANYGPFWRQMRKICVMKLFSRKRAESWQSVRDMVDNTVKKVAVQTGTAVNIGELVFELMGDIIYRAAFGTSTLQGQDEFIRILQEFSKLFGAFNIADFIPSLRWIDPQGLNKRLVKARQSLDKFIDSIIDDHIIRKRNASSKLPNYELETESDMVDELLAFYGEDSSIINASDDLQNNIKLNRDNIKGIIMDVMFGGTETVASAIEWAMSELMRSPEDLKKAQQELSQVVGLQRRVEETDLDNLTFLKCCLKETIRLHPPIPLLLHEAAEDAVIAGYFIPAKSRIMVNAWAIGRDPASWDDAETFRPTRFLEQGVPDFKGNNFEFIPFGSGRRSCPGMQLGLYGLEIAVAQLLHCFDWELPDGMKPSEMDMSDVFGLTAPRATRLVAVPTKRVLCPLL
ncbi:hypothetical protein IC582_018491 [Cucumis melo]